MYNDDFYITSTRWRENKHAFQNTNSEKILESVSRKFDVEFEITDDKIKDFTYNLIYEVNDLNSLLRLMSSITPVNFVKDTEGHYKVKLSRKIN